MNFEDRGVAAVFVKIKLRCRFRAQVSAGRLTSSARLARLFCSMCFSTGTIQAQSLTAKECGWVEWETKSVVDLNASLGENNHSGSNAIKELHPSVERLVEAIFFQCECFFDCISSRADFRKD